MKDPFLVGLIISSVLLTKCQTVKDTHWTDIIPKKEKTGNNLPQFPPDDSHKILNAKSKIIKPFREKFIKSEIPLGHTGRKEFIPLLDQRDQIEENVNRAIIGGIALHKKEGLHKQSQSMFNYAFEQRSKAQEIQRRMDQIKQAGHISRNAFRRDRKEYSRAQYHNYLQNNKELLLYHKRRKENQYRFFRDKKRRQIPDLNLPPPNHD